MCGIAGYILKESTNASVLNNMLNALYHRGPDADGLYASGNYRVGMRRLMINDLHTGNQPLFNEDRSVVLFYNGEIYNYGALKKELIKGGHSFQTNSDGEVICHLYEEYQEHLFEKLDGMFAVALWIEPEKKLILARDMQGEKPLYYSTISSNEIVFASEIKSIAKHPRLDPTINSQAIWDFPTYLWIPEPDTIYRNVKALMPGHFLVATPQNIAVKKYPNNFYPGELPSSEEDMVHEVRRVVEEAVTGRLLSDVPVGAFLSSGLDSSIVTSIASKHLKELSTFTIGFEDLDDPYHGKSDESQYAAHFAKKLGTRHYTLKVTGKDFLEKLPLLVKYGDQPFAVSSGLGILSVSEAAKKAGVKVLLSGDGADECFGGYSWYEYLSNRLVPAAGEYENVSFQNFGVELEQRLKILNSFPAPKKAWAWHYYASESEKAGLFNKDIFDIPKNSLRWFEQFSKKKKWTAKEYITQDRQFYFPNEMLRKVDRMTMAYSIEGRAPFAASSILSLADKLPAKVLIKEGKLKWILRKAFEDVLPEEVISRPKHGFNIPIDHWLKNDWAFLMEETFSPGSELSKRGLIHAQSRQLAWNMLNDPQRLNGHTLFCFIMLNMWFQNNNN